MKYVLIQHIASSQEDHERRAGALLKPIPAGVIADFAGAIDEGCATIPAWGTRSAWRSLHTSRIRTTYIRSRRFVSLELTLRNFYPADVSLGKFDTGPASVSRTSKPPRILEQRDKLDAAVDAAGSTTCRDGRLMPRYGRLARREAERLIKIESPTCGPTVHIFCKPVRGERL
jgi:hypothetical protein